MKTRKECIGCPNYMASRLGGSGPEGDYYYAECWLGFDIEEGAEPCDCEEYENK